MVGLPQGMATPAPTSFRYEVEPVAGWRLGKARDGPVVRRWLEWNELMWRPQGESHLCGRRKSKEKRCSRPERSGIGGEWA